MGFGEGGAAVDAGIAFGIGELTTGGAGDLLGAHLTVFATVTCVNFTDFVPYAHLSDCPSVA